MVEKTRSSGHFRDKVGLSGGRGQDSQCIESMSVCSSPVGGRTEPFSG